MQAGVRLTATIQTTQQSAAVVGQAVDSALANNQIAQVYNQNGGQADYTKSVTASSTGGSSGSSGSSPSGSGGSSSPSGSSSTGSGSGSGDSGSKSSFPGWAVAIIVVVVRGQCRLQQQLCAVCHDPINLRAFPELLRLPSWRHMRLT